MRKHIIITGASGCGKSTAVRSVLGPALNCAGGFITERDISPTGTVEGVSIFPAAAAFSKEEYEGRRFLDFSGAQTSHDNEAFRTFGVRLLKESVNYPFTLIDEFGGFEMLVPEFREELLKVLNSPQPLIAVLKSRENAETLRARVGLGEKYTAVVQNLHSALAAHEDTELIEMHCRGEESVLNAILQWKKEFVLC